MCPMAAAIAKSRPEIRNRCTEVHGMSPMDAAIVNSGSEIGNHCSAIVPASRIARLRKVVAATMPHPIQIFVAAKYNSSACGRSLPLRCRIRFQFSSLQSRAVPPTAPSSRQVERPKAQRLRLRFQRKYLL